MKAAITIAVLFSVVLSLKPLTKKDVRGFLNAHKMVFDAYENGHFKEVAKHGDKLLEEFSVIPLDGREKIQKNLLPKYQAVKVLVKRARVHGMVKDLMDSVKIYRKLERFAKLNESLVKVQMSIVNAATEGEGQDKRFEAVLAECGTLKDSIPGLVLKKFERVEDSKKARFIERHLALAAVLADKRKGDRGEHEEEYLEILRENEPGKIRLFIDKNPNSKYKKNLKARLSAIIGDAYYYARKGGSIEAYEDFLRQFPDSEYSNDIKDRLEYAIMRKGIAGSSLHHLRLYMNVYPNGKYLGDVNLAFERVSRGERANFRVPGYAGSK